jgi:hypothetical protein
MPWYKGSYPPSYKNQPVRLRKKAIEIANQLLLHATQEGIAIATGLKRARIELAKSTGKEETARKVRMINRHIRCLIPEIDKVRSPPRPVLHSKPLGRQMIRFSNSGDLFASAFH